VNTPTPIHDNRAQRRRQAQRELREFAHRLAKTNPYLKTTATDSGWCCAFCGSDGGSLDNRHGRGCLWAEVRDWLARHRVEQET